MSARSHIDRPLGGTAYLLEQWAIWRKVGCGGPRSLRTAPSRSLKFAISDAMAMAIDGAVARLTARERQLGDLVLAYYGDGRSALKIGKEHGISEAKTRELIAAGIAWIDCVLDHQSEPVDFRADGT